MQRNGKEHNPYIALKKEIKLRIPDSQLVNVSGDTLVDISYHNYHITATQYIFCMYEVSRRRYISSQLTFALFRRSGT